MKTSPRFPLFLSEHADVVGVSLWGGGGGGGGGVIICILFLDLKPRTHPDSSTSINFVSHAAGK